MIFSGRNVVIEALLSPHAVTKIWIDKQTMYSSKKIQTILATSKSQNVLIEQASRKDLDLMSKSEDHQGVSAEVKFATQQFKPQKSIKKQENNAYIYITEAHYEYNVGAIIRSAECSGLSGVILPKKLSITNTIAKSSTGAMFWIPIYKESIFNAIKKAKSNGYFIYGIERDGSTYYKKDLRMNGLFIIGGENKSLSDSVREKCDDILEIPQFGQVNSLNMSVASSIILFERVRQLHQNI